MRGSPAPGGVPGQLFNNSKNPPPYVKAILNKGCHYVMQ